MFAAAIPQPSHQLPGSALATGIRDAILAASWGAHCREHYAPPPTVKRRRKPRVPERKIAMQTVASIPAPGTASGLRGELLTVADAVCLILGVGLMKRVELPQAPTKPGKPSLGIGADAMVRIRVADDDELPGETERAKRAAELERRVRRRARAWVKWEGAPGSMS